VKSIVRWLVAAMMLVHPVAYGLDHKNLDEGRPIRVEDSYAIAHGEIAVEGGLGYNKENQGSDRGVFPLQILYGAFPNSHLEIGTTLQTNPRGLTGNAKSGDLELSGLYNLNQETLNLPAFGIKATVTLPTGIDSSGTDVEIKGLVTKSFSRLSLYLNASHVFVSGAGSQAGDDLHKLLLGASYPIGAPRFTRLTLVTDVFTELAHDLVGAELGFRHQFTQRIVLDAGAGTEFSGPADRASFLLRLGASIGI
jgi:hypothetical protein